MATGKRNYRPSPATAYSVCTEGFRWSVSIRVQTSQPVCSDHTNNITTQHHTQETDCEKRDSAPKHFRSSSSFTVWRRGWLVYNFIWSIEVYNPRSCLAICTNWTETWCLNHDTLLLHKMSVITHPGQCYINVICPYMVCMFEWVTFNSVDLKKYIYISHIFPLLVIVTIWPAFEQTWKHKETRKQFVLFTVAMCTSVIFLCLNTESQNTFIKNTLQKHKGCSYNTVSQT